MLHEPPRENKQLSSIDPPEDDSVPKSAPTSPTRTSPPLLTPESKNVLSGRDRLAQSDLRPVVSEGKQQRKRSVTLSSPTQLRREDPGVTPFTPFGSPVAKPPEKVEKSDKIEKIEKEKNKSETKPSSYEHNQALAHASYLTNTNYIPKGNAEKPSEPMGFFTSFISGITNLTKDTKLQAEKTNLARIHHQQQIQLQQQHQQQQQIQQIQEETSGEQLFQDIFEYPPTEKLLADYKCCAVTKKCRFKGRCYISPKYCSFNASQNARIMVIIPWVEVGQIKLAPASKPTTIQLFTNDSKVHQFTDFQVNLTTIFNLMQFVSNIEHERCSKKLEAQTAQAKPEKSEKQEAQPSTATAPNSQASIPLIPAIHAPSVPSILLPNPNGQHPVRGHRRTGSMF